MEDFSALCFQCMGLLDENGNCPHCGNSALPPQESPLLPLGTVINERYLIGKVIKTNGEGSAYVALDTKLNRPCTLREFFPSAIAERDIDGVNVLPYVGSQTVYESCLDSFFKLWTKLMRLKGLSALISVYDVIKLNSTAYAVYSDSEELTLRGYLLSNGQGYISWEQARILFMPTLSTIVTLHTSGIIHKGISPSAFIISPEGKLKLTDFCTTQARTAFGDLEADVNDGYAPLEIYSDNGNIGPWTDIYSFTAVLFRTLVGSTPISAPIRAENDQMMIPAKFAEQLPPYVINSIINGMQLDANERTRNAEQLRSNLSASPRAIGASAAIFSKNTTELNAQATARKITHEPQPVSRNYESKPVNRAYEQKPVNRTYEQKPAQPNKDGEISPYAEKLSPERIAMAQQAEIEANRKNNLHKRLTVLLIFVLVLLLVGIGLVVSEIINSSADKQSTEQTTEVTAVETAVVPQFVGQMYDAITTDTYYSALFTFKATTTASDTVPRGQIIAQSIPASTTVNRGTLIELTVSTGADSFTIPDVTGLTYEEALAQLSALGLVCTRSVKYNDGTNAPDTVAETVPAANTQAKSGDAIYIVMWSSLETEPASEQESTDSQSATVDWDYETDPATDTVTDYITP